MTNVFSKLNAAREIVHGGGLKKTGKMANSRNGYFELADFIQPALAAFKQVGLCGVVSFPEGTARMTITDTDDPSQSIVIESPMGSASLKGCHEVQNIGAVQTYQRRYLWMDALEIIEHDALDAAVGRGEEPAPPKELPSGPINEKTRDWLAGQIDAAQIAVGEVCKAFEVTSLKALTYEQMDAVQQWLRDNRKAA